MQEFIVYPNERNEKMFFTNYFQNNLAEAQIKYKHYRNLLPTLMKEIKRSFFTNYFQNNLNDLKSTWKSIKKLISF